MHLALGVHGTVALKEQLREGFVAGRDAYEQNAAKRLFWERLILVGVVVSGGSGTESWLSHHSSLAWGWRFLVAISVTGLLGILCSLLLDRLRKGLHR